MSFDSINKGAHILGVIGHRQQVLGSNLVNMNTPGYQRKDIDFNTYLGSLNSPLESEMSKKLGPSQYINNSGGGEVNPAYELIEMQKNNIYYSIATRRVSSAIQEMKTVLNVGK